MNDHITELKVRLQEKERERRELKRKEYEARMRGIEEMNAKANERMAEIMAKWKEKESNPVRKILTDTVKSIKRVLKDQAFKDVYEAECREEIEKLLKEISTFNRKLGNPSYSWKTAKELKEERERMIREGWMNSAKSKLPK